MCVHGPTQDSGSSSDSYDAALYEIAVVLEL